MMVYSCMGGEKVREGGRKIGVRGEREREEGGGGERKGEREGRGERDGGE